MTPKFQYAHDDLVRVMQNKGYAVFTKGDYNLNLIGVRTGTEVTNRFDDTFVCMYYIDGKLNLHQWGCTTDPGSYWIKAGGMSPKGCAIIKPGQYRGAYKLGLHQGKYKALVQTGAPITVYRDGNKDDIYDYTKPETGFFGCNIHRSSPTGTSIQVDKWSAGCQVLADINDYNKLMELCEIASARYGNKFTYTLLERKDFDV